MRRLIWLLPALLFALAACGTATNAPDDGSGAQPSTQTDEYTASAAPESSEATASTAAASTQAAAGDDPASRNNKYSAAPEMQIDPNKTYTATIETNKGTMTAELYASEAPMTVNNFVFLARDNFYNDVPFHRIVKDFMVQTGDPTGTGTGGPGYRFEDEPVNRSYERGTLAMANSGADTNGSQFFIVLQDSGLPPDYTIFGKLTGGLEVLDALGNTPVTEQPVGGEVSRPTEDVHITGITVQEQ